MLFIFGLSGFSTSHKYVEISKPDFREYIIYRLSCFWNIEHFRNCVIYILTSTKNASLIITDFLVMINKKRTATYCFFM